MWLSLADNHIKELRIDWDRMVRFAFNERSNPDDNTLGMQIVKVMSKCTYNKWYNVFPKIYMYYVLVLFLWELKFDERLNLG